MGACCSAFCKGIAICCKYTYNGVVYCKNKVKDCCSLWWYPLKERCCACCDCCDKYMNPYKDESYSTI
ncbi:unnamed protein product [Blepharisma stoltei]|uniref:Uncharacterized protein n=1 Tax=Blepharisma stoltei TaxID=1481888 RepID=A0AAU9IWU4_9CILI|nr:unnamed protein product [Blepharisma stoltei]